jgi:ABC-2 type transport system permease protein
VRLGEEDEQFAVLAETPKRKEGQIAFVVSFAKKTLVIAEMEARRIRHDPTDIITRAIQPAIWLLVFGQVFTRTRVIPTGHMSYMDFMAPGVLAQSVLFIAIFYGIAVIWERDLGIIQKLLVSPTPRQALVLGRALSAGARALPQAVIIYILCLLVGVHMDYSVLAILGVVAAVVLGACIFAIFSMIIAALVKKRERFMGIGQILTMPLFFASNAIYPIDFMPPWLQVTSRLNPLTYEVDALRGLMLAHGECIYGLHYDFAVLLGVVVFLVFLGGRLYPKVMT